MDTTRTYTTGQVARALKIPVRRMEGWAEQGLLVPKVLRGQTRHGDRRRYGWKDVITAAVLAELHRLLGARFRPGGIAALAARALVHFDLDKLGDRPLVLVLTVAGKGGPGMEFVYKDRLDHLPPAALIINLVRLIHQTEEGLAREG
jgi:hypothetical protein